MHDKIIIKGAREHNLQNVNLTIPKNKLVVFTGISGSGKSSMAFDTIFAEGQRRYVESLSAYARQFLGVMGKPDVDLIEGLSPSIAIDQRSVSKNPRSTVGTITEIHDYLRLLFSRIGHPFCPNCKTEITRLTPDEIKDRVVDEMAQDTQKHKLAPRRFQIRSPVVQERKGEFKGLFDNLKSKGFSEAVVDGKTIMLDEDISLLKTNKHTIEVMIDTFSMSHKDMKNQVFVSNLGSRIFQAVEQSLKLSDGLVLLVLGDEKHLYSEKFSCPACNLSLPELEPRVFSFNSPFGACPTCKGIGTVSQIDPSLVLNGALSISEGGIIPFGKMLYRSPWFTRLLETVLEEEGIDTKAPIDTLSAKEKDVLLWGKNRNYRVRGRNRFGQETVVWKRFRGIIPELKKRYWEAESDYTKYEVERYMVQQTCDDCQGCRLRPEVLSVKIQALNIHDMSQKSIGDLLPFVKQLAPKFTAYENEISGEIIKEITNRLTFLTNVGLSYLTLNRQAASLSGGEAQRIRLASQIGSGLTGVTYVLDEPSIGLHPKDVTALLVSLKSLRDLGNTIIVVEHDLETVRAADFVADFGPGAGKRGGSLVFAGDTNTLKEHPTSLTGRYLSGKSKIRVRESNGEPERGGEHVSLTGCSQYNLKDISINVPLGMLTCVSGVSGSGKSTLIVETLYKALKAHVEQAHISSPGAYESLDGHQYIDKVYLVDQSPIGRTPRSNPATYIGLFDHIRDLFAQTLDARERGYKKGRFSFNVKGGRCEKCQGGGSIRIEMQFLPDVYVKCDVCEGRRYNSETLEVKYKGKNIYDILRLTVEEAEDFFKSHSRIYEKLKVLSQVGLSYIELGQPAPTLSGGEAQRVKLAHELTKKETGRTLYILDEPTTGLHLYDIEKLLHTLNKLVERGNTVVIIEHNLDVIKNCQYIIDLGPEGGDAGGYVLFQGPVRDIVNVRNSHTGRFIKTNGDIF